jgi:hypothetical protein
MIKLLQFLWDGCWHNWERGNGVPRDYYDTSYGEKHFVYRAVPKTCSKCGKVGIWKDKGGTHL